MNHYYLSHLLTITGQTLEEIDRHTLILILSIAFSLIALLIMIIGWFIAKAFKDQKESYISLQKSLLDLSESLNNLSISVGKMEVLNRAKDESCILSHRIIDKRLQEHGDKLDRHETEIAVIKVKVDER